MCHFPSWDTEKTAHKQDTLYRDRHIQNDGWFHDYGIIVICYLANIHLWSGIMEFYEN